jgi:uncharacterized protein DUF541
MGLRQQLGCVLLLPLSLLCCHAQIAQIYPQRNTIITGDCEADLKPALAVISGGVAAAALKPSDAVDQLNKQMELIRSYVKENHGTLKELERVRMVHTEGTNNGQPRDPSFQIAQRLRAEFPVDAPVDNIFQRLMELGMDRFGDNMSAPDYRQSIAVIHFEIPNFETQIKQIQQRCTAEAWKHWCAAETTKTAACQSATPPESLQVQSFSLRSTEKLMRAEGPPDYFHFNFPNYGGYQQLTPPELLGNVTMHLIGNIVFNGPDVEKNNPEAVKR